MIYKKDIENIIKSREKTQSLIQVLEAKLESKIKFHFCIQFIYGDGFCILELDKAKLTPIAEVLKHLEKEKEYTENDHDLRAI